MDLLFNEGSFPSYKTFGIIGLGLASFGGACIVTQLSLICSKISTAKILMSQAP